MDTLNLSPTRMYVVARDLRHREDGQAMVEYALILAMVSVAAFAILFTIGGTVSSIFSSVNGDF